MSWQVFADGAPELAAFELDVERAMSTLYGADGRPHRERWRALDEEWRG